jgi:thiamine-phosphate pyrophosphorylase
VRQLDARAVFRDWLDAGVRLIQLRAKTLASGPLLELAQELAADARAAGATFVLNDRADLARLAGASGVHVGQTDLSPADARRVLAADAIVGLSTHSEAELAAAMDGPIDYVAVGAVFQTSMKGPAHPVVGLDFVRRAAALGAACAKPIVGIGGITIERAASVIDSGASSVAVITDLLSGDPGVRAREYLAVLGL